MTRITKTIQVAIAVAGCSMALHAQWLNRPTPGIPRTADGKPNLSAPAPRTTDGKTDFSGLWSRSSNYRANVMKDISTADLQPSVKALVQQRTEDLSKDHMSALCLPLGPGYAVDADSNGGGMMKIIQMPALILILNPDLTYRQVFMDGRELEANPTQPAWMGYSVGRWEGDVLVVESSGYNDRTWLDYNGHPHTEGLRITERYRRKDFGHLDLEITFADPAIYSKPWTIKVTADLAPDTEILEYVCNEHSKGHEHWVGKASDQQKTDVKLALEVLAKYAGTYLEQPKYWRSKPRTVKITLVDGVLYGRLDDKEEERQFAHSETMFSGIGGLAIEFIRDAQGTPTGLYVNHVSGNYRFAKQ